MTCGWSFLCLFSFFSESASDVDGDGAYQGKQRIGGGVHAFVFDFAEPLEVFARTQQVYQQIPFGIGTAHEAQAESFVATPSVETFYGVVVMVQHGRVVRVGAGVFGVVQFFLKLHIFADGLRIKAEFFPHASAQRGIGEG